MSRGNRIDIIDLTGQRFGKLVVITRAERRRIGITPQSLSQRIKAGWPLEDALACS